MSLEDFQLKQALGKGSFGSVSKCVRKSDGEVYAIKQIKIHKLKEKDKNNALNEIRFLASIESPYVISYKEAFYDQPSQNLCIVMELANGGDLQGRIKRALATKTRIPQNEIWRVAYNVLEGLQKLHENNILHRDIKPANLFFHDGVAKIADLNISKHLVDQFTHTQTGTPYYASPQIWNEQPYSFKCDIWSLGCVLYEMAMLRQPFKADTPQKLFKKISVGEYDKVGIPYSKDLSWFISKLLTHKQKDRPGTKELLCYPKMMDLKENWDDGLEKDKLMETIQLPKNFKTLNQNLPKAKYSQSKTTKVITFDDDDQEEEENISRIARPKSTVRLPLPSLKTIGSQKRIKLPQNANQGDRQNGCLARKPRVFRKLGSKKLIF